LSLGSGGLGSGSLVLSLGSGRLKAQPIEPEEPAHKIPLEIPVIRYLPLFLKFYYLIQKLSLIIHCNTCDALFIYNVLYRLRLA
jgi:hypothetical protein